MKYSYGVLHRVTFTGLGFAINGLFIHKYCKEITIYGWRCVTGSEGLIAQLVRALH